MDQRRAAGRDLVLSPADPGPALDPAVLDGLRDLDRRTRSDLLVRVARIFLVEAAQDLATLAEAVERRDIAGVATVAHELKGRSAMIGARGLARTCAAIERMNDSADEGVAAALVRLVGVAETELRRVQEALVTLVLAAPSPGAAEHNRAVLGGAPCGS